MSVGNQDPLQVGDRAAHRTDRRQDRIDLIFAKRVDERQLGPVEDEEGPNPAPLVVPDGDDARRDLHATSFPP